MRNLARTLAPFSISSLEFDLLAQSFQKSHDRYAPEERDNDGRRNAEGLHGILEGLGEEYHDERLALCADSFFRSQPSIIE